MTFDDREQSVHEGEPVECYRFAVGTTVYRWTSADADVTLSTGTYTPAVISRGSLVQSQEDSTDSLEVMVPRYNPIATLFMPYVPGSKVLLTVYRAHRGEESEARPLFLGEVASVVVKDNEATLTCTPLVEALGRPVPSISYQPLCNWPLYGAGCGVNAADFRDAAVVGSVSGVTVVSSTFAAKPDGWYTNGWMEDPDGEVRFITAHVGNTITLMSPYPDLTAGDTVHVLAGCDRTEATCVAKFNNFVNFMGFPRLPDRNPFNGAIA
ncbi:MAG TPA: DUF2163 domain-containing protein [Candidatus Eisenbacteria bacterium]|nr:DUF2163 domain-containing protein [Candidatus Eisenbacteria bacterium]